jgi:hypothetical protein
MNLQPEWLQEIYRMRVAQDYTTLTKEDVLKLVEWIERDKYSEEDAFLLLRLLRMFENEISISWEIYYKRFIQKYRNPSLLAQFHLWAAHRYVMEDKINEAEEVATLALSLDAGDYDVLSTYLSIVAELSIDTQIQLIEQCLSLRPNNRMAMYNAIARLFSLYQRTEATGQRLHQRILDLCDELLAKYGTDNNYWTKTVENIRHKVSSGSITWHR